MKIKRVVPRQIVTPIKVMWISNSSHLMSGYSTVTREICSRMGSDQTFDVLAVGMQHTGKVELKENFKSVGVVQGKVFESIQQHIIDYKPHVTIILEDPFTMMNNNFHKLELYGSKLIVYSAIDGINMSTNSMPIHRNADLNIGMANFTTNQLKDAGFNAVTIWHGSSDKYKPVQYKVQKKIKLLHGYAEDDIIFYSYFRNSGRKAPQTNLEIMASVLNELPSNYKYLAHTINADDRVNDMIDFRDRILKKKYGQEVTDRIIITNTGVSEETMIQQMQMCDYVIHSSTGGGFEIIMSDAMSCGRICIANDYSTTHELLVEEKDGIGQRGVVVKPAYKLTSSYNVEHGHPDKVAFKDAILSVVNDLSNKDKLKLIENGLKFSKKFLTWDNITLQFKNQIKKII